MEAQGALFSLTPRGLILMLYLYRSRTSFSKRCFRMQNCWSPLWESLLSTALSKLSRRVCLIANWLHFSSTDLAPRARTFPSSPILFSFAGFCQSFQPTSYNFSASCKKYAFFKPEFSNAALKHSSKLLSAKPRKLQSVDIVWLKVSLQVLKSSIEVTGASSSS